MQSKAKKRRIVLDNDEESSEENNNVELDPATFNYKDLEEKLRIHSDDEEITDEHSVWSTGQDYLDQQRDYILKMIAL